MLIISEVQVFEPIDVVDERRILGVSHTHNDIGSHETTDLLFHNRRYLYGGKHVNPGTYRDPSLLRGSTGK